MSDYKPYRTPPCAVHVHKYVAKRKDGKTEFECNKHHYQSGSGRCQCGWHFEDKWMSRHLQRIKEEAHATAALPDR